MSKIKAGQAIAQVLINWGVDHIYGITADSINNTVDGFYQERDRIKYIQVRHEEAGALASAADAKLTGRIGVSFGSAGPGAVHLLNGLYDAKMDRVPVLALVGQSATSLMNTNFFQEMNQDPIFADVAAFHKQVTNAAQIPYVVDEAIRSAYASNSVSVVIIPDDLSGQEIDFTPFKTAAIARKSNPLLPSDADIDKVQKALQAAIHPVLWVGKGVFAAKDELISVSEKFAMPVLSTAPATGVMPTDHPNFMGSRGRLGTKPAFEVSQAADLILFIGTNFPFARYLPAGITFIQVNNDLADLGKQHDADITVLADAKAFLQALLAVKADPSAKQQAFLKAAQSDKSNWDNWLDRLADDDSQGLRAEGVLKAVKQFAKDDAVFALDVGNNTEWGIRQLPLNKKQLLTMSGWYGTMGYGLPAGLAGQLDFPDCQVWNISGDGGFAMMMQDLLTEVKYQLPVINIVLENKVFGFIQHEKLMAKQAPYGIDIIGADWAQIAKGMGAIAFTAHNLTELSQALAQIASLEKQGNQLPIVIDAKIRNIDPVDTHYVPLDPDVNDPAQIKAYREQYELDQATQPALSELLKKYEAGDQNDNH